jgi:hypothetical protein
VFTTEQWDSMSQMTARLNELVAETDHVIRVAKQIVQLQTDVKRLRPNMAPRQLRQADIDDPDMGLCQAIDYASDPQGHLFHADLLLGEAMIAVNEGRLTEAYPRINEAAQIVAYMHAIGTAMVHGALVECG